MAVKLFLNIHVVIFDFKYFVLEILKSTYLQHM